MFRDDHDALLARLDAVDAERARLEGELSEAIAARDRAIAERDRAIAERDQAIAERAKAPAVAEPARAKTPGRAKAPGRELDRHVVGLIGFVVVLGISMVLLLSRSQCGGAQTRAPDAGRRADYNLYFQRACLDNADLYLRVFLAAPEGARHDQVRGHLRSCLAMLDGDALPAPAAAYRDALAAWQPTIDRLTVYYETRQFEDDGGALARELAPEHAEQVATWRAASAALRGALDAPYRELRERAIAAREASGPTGTTPAMRFAMVAAELFDLLAADQVEPGALEATLARLREARSAAGVHARADMADFVSTATQLVATATARGGPAIQADTAGAAEILGGIYNGHGYDRADPF